MSPRPSRSRPHRSRILAAIPAILLAALALVLALALAIGPLAAIVAPAPSRAAVPADARLMLNQKRMEIAKLIELVSKETGRTILYDEQVRGLVSLVSKRPVTPDEAWEILASALQMLGFSLLPSTVDQWRIARVAEAVGESPFVGTARRESDRYVTALIPLEFANLQAVLSVLQPLGGTSVTLVAIEQTNSLIASGPERAIARLTALADELDRFEERALRQRVLRHRDVADVEAMIQAQFDAGRFDARALELWSDARTNSLIFRGTDDAVDRLIAFIERIDEPLEGEGEIRVLRILNRDAADIARILGGQVPSGAGSSSTGRTRDRSQGRDRSGAAGRDSEGLEDASADLDDSGGLDDSGQAQGQGQGASGTDAASAIDVAALIGGEDYSIAVDPATRSLVVRASRRGHAVIRELVEELDASPQLIAVDVTVSEVRTPTTWALALSWHLPLLPGDSLDELVGRIVSIPVPGRGLGTVPIDDGALFGRVSRDSGLDFEVPGEGGVQIPLEDTVVIDAADRKIRVDVLIQPSLVLIAGEEHEIFVGANVPIPVSSGSPLDSVSRTAGGVAVPSLRVDFNREDIGVRLTLAAQAGVEGPIQLDIDAELSDVAPSLAGDPAKVGPTLTKRLLSAKARLEDGETAILGLDRENRETTSQGGTPWLADIPLIGWFFKARGQQVSDVRVVIAARARRLRTPSELVADTIRRRLVLERQRLRAADLPPSGGAPYGVRVTTRTLEDDALAIAGDLERRGHEAVVHRWLSADRRPLFDVYVLGLESMVDAGELAQRLAEDGWDADLVVFTSRS
ncbi:MAG: secretin N-terminal domain-containing protein [Myxococcota bacterium]